MNQTQIEHFLELTKYLSFTKASESLYIAQPALSRSIAKLEKELGFPLFIRNKRKVSLTTAGLIMMKGLKKLSKEYDNLLNLAKYANRNEETSLNISILECQDTSCYLHDVTKFFSEKYPMIDIQINTGTFKFLKEELLNGRTDIIITQLFDLTFEERKNFNIEYLSSVNVGCIVSKKHHLAGFDKIDIKQLHGETLIAIDIENSNQGFISAIDFFKKRDIRIKSVITSKNLHELNFKVEAGFGFALWDSNFNINTYNTKFLEIENMSSLATLVGVWKKDNLKNSILSFFNFLKNKS